jgi:hypothetical protein
VIFDVPEWDYDRDDYPDIDWTEIIFSVLHVILT